MQTLGRDDECVGHLLFLLVALAGACVARAYPYAPPQVHFQGGHFHIPEKILGQRTQRRDPEHLKALFRFKRLFWKRINMPDQNRQPQRIGFPAAGRCIHQSAFSSQVSLCRFLLKSGPFPLFIFKPLLYNSMSARFGQSSTGIKRIKKTGKKKSSDRAAEPFVQATPPEAKLKQNKQGKHLLSCLRPATTITIR